MASFIGELLNVCLNYLDPPVKLRHPEEDGEIHLAVFEGEENLCILFCLVSR